MKSKMAEFQKAFQHACRDVAAEQARQFGRWGWQHHSYQAWRAIFDEELAEFNCAVLAANTHGYDELVQVVAVGLSWLADILVTIKDPEPK